LPISFAVDHEKRRVSAVGAGTFTMEEMRTYIEERTRQGAYEYPQVLDMLNCIVDVPLSESMLARAQETRKELKTGPIPRTAIIAQPGTATYGFFRQLATQVSFVNASVQVFTTRDEAVTWLEADEKGSD
jgi:hypothetical protein